MGEVHQQDCGEAWNKELTDQVQGKRELTDEERNEVKDTERIWNESVSERVFEKWMDSLESQSYDANPNMQN